VLSDERFDAAQLERCSAASPPGTVRPAIDRYELTAGALTFHLAEVPGSFSPQHGRRGEDRRHPPAEVAR